MGWIRGCRNWARPGGRCGVHPLRLGRGVGNIVRRRGRSRRTRAGSTPSASCRGAITGRGARAFRPCCPPVSGQASRMRGRPAPKGTRQTFGYRTRTAGFDPKRTLAFCAVWHPIRLWPAANAIPRAAPRQDRSRPAARATPRFGSLGCRSERLVSLGLEYDSRCEPHPRRHPKGTLISPCAVSAVQGRRAPGSW
jgi:hypothetical protein